MENHGLLGNWTMAAIAGVPPMATVFGGVPSPAWNQFTDTPTPAPEAPTRAGVEGLGKQRKPRRGLRLCGCGA